MAVYGPVRHQKNIIWIEAWGPYNIFLVTDRSIYCHILYIHWIVHPCRFSRILHFTFLFSLFGFVSAAGHYFSIWTGQVPALMKSAASCSVFLLNNWCMFSLRCCECIAYEMPIWKWLIFSKHNKVKIKKIFTNSNVINFFVTQWSLNWCQKLLTCTCTFGFYIFYQI
jgi:hypothetical protein